MSDEVELAVVDTGKRIRFFTSYDYSKDFLGPSDIWSISTGDASIVEDLRKELIPGTRVRLFANARPQATGIVDKRGVKSSSKGTTLTIQGRDPMGLVVDACIDPTISFGPNTTLLDALTAIFAPFGFKVFATSDLVNRQIVSGNDPRTTVLRSTTPKTTLSVSTLSVGKTGAIEEERTKKADTSTGVTQQYDPTRPTFLKDFKLDQLKPRIGEGCYELAARLCKRFGLHLWIDALGETVIVGEPDFAQRATYRIVHRVDGSRGGVNVLDGEEADDWTAQPSVIIAVGRGGGGNFARAKLCVAMVNELTGCDALGRIRPDVRAAISKFKSAVILPIRPQLLQYASRFRESYARPCYLNDEESQNIGQLEGFVRREMASRQSKASQVTYLVEGHSQAGAPWALNSIVDVDDDRLDIHAPMWLRARQFTKSAGTGTLTKLTLAVPYTIEI